MKSQTGWNEYQRPILLGVVIAIAVLLAAIFGLPKMVAIPLFMLLGLGAAATALWIHARRRADGSEWWQDDNASGWRGY
jgi:hypothetical protein